MSGLNSMGLLGADPIDFLLELEAGSDLLLENLRTVNLLLKGGAVEVLVKAAVKLSSL